MSENKEYISRQEELGSVNISEEVLSAIAGAAALEVDGVGALSSGLSSDMAAKAGRKALSKGVHLHVEQDEVTVSIAVLVRYGHVVPEVARAVQDAVKSALENTSGMRVAGVHVAVTGVSFSK